MVNMLTYFVNIHAHSSIKHTMISSRVTGTIANKTEETTQYLKKAKTSWCWRCYPRIIFFHKINRTYQLSCLYNQHKKYTL